MRLLTKGAEATRDVGAAIATVVQPGDLIVLAGELGTGKTVLAQGIGRGLDVEGPVTSPSFVIVREHQGRLGLVHVDVYRLDHFQEVYDLGLEELFDGDRVTVIEWGDRITPLLPGDRLDLRLDFDGDDSERVIQCAALGPTWDVRRRALEDALRPWEE